MTLVVVPVRYPLTRHSRATLAEAIRIAEEEDADLTVLHVDLHQDSHGVTLSELKHAVEAEFGVLDRVRYAIRRAFLVEEAILEEVVEEDAEIVVIGDKQVGRWRRMLGRVLDHPDVGSFLRTELDCTLITVDANR